MKHITAKMEVVLQRFRQLEKEKYQDNMTKENRLVMSGLKSSPRGHQFTYQDVKTIDTLGWARDGEYKWWFETATEDLKSRRDKLQHMGVERSAELALCQGLLQEAQDSFGRAERAHVAADLWSEKQISFLRDNAPPNWTERVAQEIRRREEERNEEARQTRREVLDIEDYQLRSDLLSILITEVDSERARLEDILANLAAVLPDIERFNGAKEQKYFYNSLHRICFRVWHRTMFYDLVEEILKDLHPAWVEVKIKDSVKEFGQRLDRPGEVAILQELRNSPYILYNFAMLGNLHAFLEDEGIQVGRKLTELSTLPMDDVGLTDGPQRSKIRKLWITAAVKEMFRSWQQRPRMNFEESLDILDRMTNGMNGRNTIGDLLFLTFRSPDIWPLFYDKGNKWTPSLFRGMINAHLETPLEDRVLDAFLVCCDKYNELFQLNVRMVINFHLSAPAFQHSAGTY